MIDIVIPWLNPTNDWYEDYKKYCENESPGRIRDLNTMKYTLRSIAKNCKWLNKLYLVVYNEKQIPNWINKNCDKLKIIYHKDIIPQEFLPNFNSLITSLYIHKIPGLLDNVVISDDDMWFMKDIPEYIFFENNRPVHQFSGKPGIYKNKGPMWDDILRTTYNIFKKITNKEMIYTTYHMPLPINIKMQKFIWFKYKNILEASCKNAKIRRPYSITNELFYYLDEALNIAINKPIYKELITGSYIQLADNLNAEKLNTIIDNSHLICLNDNESLKNISQSLKFITDLGEKYFPKKSCFEI